MDVHEYIERLKPLQSDLVDIENTISKLKAEQDTITQQILELTKEFQKEHD